MHEIRQFRLLLSVNLITIVFIPLVLILLYLTRSMLPPVLSALLVAYLFQPVVVWGQRLGIPRVFTAVVLVVLLIGTFLLLGIAVGPAFKQRVSYLLETPATNLATAPEASATAVAATPDGAPAATVAKPSRGTPETAEKSPNGNRLQQAVDGFLKRLQARGLAFERTAVVQWLSETVTGAGLHLLRSATNLAVELGRFLMIFFFVLIFALADGDKLPRTLLAMVPNEFFESAVCVVCETQRILGCYLRGLFVENLILFAVTLALMVPITLVGELPWLLAFVIAVVIALTNVIRIIGPIVGGLAAVILVLTTTGNPLAAGSMLATVLLIQLLDNVVILPMVMQDQVNIHPVICLLGVFAGGILGGVLGMILAIPVISGIKVLYRVISIESKQFVAARF